MTTETQFFDLCGVVRDNYKRKMQKASKDYEQKLAEIREKYKGGFAQEESRKAKQHFEEIRQTLTEEAQKSVLDAFGEAEIKEKARVSCFTVASDKMRALDALQGVPISREEFALIAENCAGCGYWVQSKLRKIAEENGIMQAPGLDATFSEKMEALQTARDRLLEYIEKADFDKPDFSVTDTALRSLESRFSNGFQHYGMSAEKSAGLVLDKAKKTGDTVAAALIVKNALETAEDAVKAEIIKQLHGSYWESVKEYGVNAVIDRMQKKEKTSAKEALALVTDARLAGEVAKLTEAERDAARYGSGIYPENTGSARKIDKQGLEFLKTEEGRQMVARFERVQEDVKRRAEDRKKEADARAELGA
jgi:hypothetical protein